jgi:hypothetical protein
LDTLNAVFMQSTRAHESK